HGESTVQYGPRRPFQTAPAVQRPPHIAIPARPTPSHAQTAHAQPLTPTQSLFRQIRDSITSVVDDAASQSRPRPSSSWTSYPGARASGSWYNQGPGPTSPSPHAPPLPPRPATANPPSPESPISDFAREFYAAGSGNVNETQHQRRSSASSSASASASVSHAPTSTPTPGRPLLRDGKLLVYPKGYVCRKCTFPVSSLLSITHPSTGSNVGYKHSDPSHPCTKCWSKYAKPFSGPLAYSYSAPSDEPTSSTFQRPLPNFRSPRSPPAPAPAPHPQTYAQPQPPVPPPANYGYGHPTAHPPAHRPNTIPVSPWAAPPPGAPVYYAGDARLGGRMCWNCAGKGRVTLFFFDSTCEVCEGIGRVYP
ncbi:hypothetical protein C0993_012650, partial [Termitomyces sp. T159_Od127]